MSSRYGLQIRGPDADDAAGLAELLGAAGVVAAAPAVAERIEALRHDKGVLLIAVEWGPPSGVIAVHWRPTLTDARPVAEVGLLLVGPDERRRGIGRLLLKAASQAARSAGCDVLRLVALPGQSDLQAFCRATGFSETGAVFVRSLRKKG